MRKPKELPEGALEKLAQDLKQAKTKAEFQSVQCLWLRASLKLSEDQVAIAIGWHPEIISKTQNFGLPLNKFSQLGSKNPNLVVSAYNILNIYYLCILT